MKLILCASQQENSVPYRFTATGIQVYTFEEALYHVYHYWKQSVDDITASNLISWVSDTLGLAVLASKLKEIAKIEIFSERMLTFLGVIEYFEKSELAALKPQLERWEKRLEWETYKERADDMVKRGEPDKAIPLYHRALHFDKNIPVLNNLSVAYMQMEAYKEACIFLEQALEMEKCNWELILHYAEALLHNNRITEGAKAIELAAEVSPEAAKGDILYLRGELSLRKGKHDDAISYFEQAIALYPQDQYVFRLSDVYVGRRQFEKALDVLNHFIPDPVKERNISCLMKEAELHSLAGNLFGAIQTIKRAQKIKPDYVELWVRLARYLRLDYNLPKAEEAIDKALSLDSSNERARLESARIKKGTGHTKSYQQLLKGILAEFKGRYREVH
ncbi:MAG: tetratricopeptide repeat protein [Defluviitaleaceae bacterium]|nr:tetratricopeptide repeat protein [Defluviitaleaceae bacterium]